MTDRAAVFLRGARDCFGVPALALTAALTGYGMMARGNGLDLAVTVASMVALWGLPAMMTFAEIFGAAGGPVLMGVTILLINIRTLPLVIATMPLVRSGRNLHWSHFIHAQFISPTNWAQIEAKQSELSAPDRPAYFLGFSLVMWAGGGLGTVLGYEFGAALPAFIGKTKRAATVALMKFSHGQNYQNYFTENLMPKCSICEKRVSKPRTGRSPAYCSESCRRVAEYRLRRMQDSLKQNEVELRNQRLVVANPNGLRSLIKDEYGRSPDSVLVDLETEHHNLEMELLNTLRGLGDEV